jgi:hypothetical protein
MPELSFRAVGAEAVKWAASPGLGLRLEVTNRPENETVHAILLQCQVRIDAPRRAYSEAERAALVELYGAPADWGRTLKSLLWTNASTSVSSFAGTTEAELWLPCTFDFASISAKYFSALEGGEVPLVLLFKGTVFSSSGEGELIVSPLPWTSEAHLALPVDVWQKTLDHYYPNSAPLRVRRDTFDRLYRFQVDRGLPTFDHAIEMLLERATP